MSYSSQSILQAIVQHQQQLYQCTACDEMIPPVVTGSAVASKVLMIGQAPGDKEGPAGKLFAWTAGKTLFKWFASIGIDEETFRQRAYMAAVCRCFPGKNPKGGDRVPSKQEIANCSEWLKSEFQILEPELAIPVGKLAIAQMMPVGKLTEVIGKQHRIQLYGREVDVIPLPHPSGASTWHRMQPGIELLQQALHLLESHPAWQTLIKGDAS